MSYQARPPAGDSSLPDRVPVNEDTFAVVFGWMVSRLGLKGASLFIYASIFGLTNSFGCFSAGVKYLMEWTGISRAQVYRVLGFLEEMGILVSFKHWNGYEWVIAYAAFRTREDMEAWKASHLLPGEPPADSPDKSPSGDFGSGTPSSGRRRASVSEKPVSVPSGKKPVARIPVKKKDSAVPKPQARQPACPAPAVRERVSAVPAVLPKAQPRSEVPPGGGLVDRIYELWKGAGLVGKGVSRAMFATEFDQALRNNIRKLRINQVDLEAAVKNYIAVLAIPPEERWWTAKIPFESFTKQVVLRFLPCRFELDTYRKIRPGIRSGTSGCSSESRIRLDF